MKQNEDDDVEEWILSMNIDKKTVLGLKELSIRTNVSMKDYANEFIKHGVELVKKGAGIGI